MRLQEYLREPFGMTNSRISYVYLVEENSGGLRVQTRKKS